MVQENNPAALSKEELVKLLRSNIKQFNKYREDTSYEALDLTDGKFQGATLTGAKLRNVDFTGANFEYANLCSADLSDCVLKNALLIYANVTQAQLVGADLEGADFTGAQLEGANLDGANLSMSLFSQANLTNVSLNQADLESTNFCSANLSSTNFKNALNIKYCIFDKFTRWPAETYLPKDFNPGRGMYGSEEDFSTTVVEHETVDESRQDMTPDDLKTRLMDEVQITGKGLPEIEKKQILLDRKLDYIIATMKVLSEKVLQMAEHGPAAGGYSDEYGTHEGFESSGGLNYKLQELDDKVENIAGILTRFPVKSLEETYKLTDVIKRIEDTQGGIHNQLNQSVNEISKANAEIQSILSGKLRASYISGLDRMFIDSVNAIKESLNQAQEKIIKESSEMKFDLDETVIMKELEKQVGTSMALLRQDLDRKLGTHGLFLKQMDEKIQTLQEKTDVEALLNKFRDEIDYKLGQISDNSEHVTESFVEHFNTVLHRLRVVDQKIDVMSETSTLSSISNLIAEFGSGFSTELQMVKEAAIAIENRLKGLTGEVDLSTDFAIDSIAKAVNNNLASAISDAVQNAQTGGMGDFKTLSENLNHKLELLGKILDAKTNHLEARVHDAVKDASMKAMSSPEFGLASDLQDLKDVSNALANQIEELRNMGPEQAQVQNIKDDLLKSVQEIMSQTKGIADDEESEELQNRAHNLQSMSEKISEKLDQLYNTFDQKTDVLEEKVDEIAHSELEELMSEFSQELEDLRSSVTDLDSNTRETIKVQGISSQEVINGLREDLTASVDEVLRSIRNMEEEGLLDAKDGHLSSIRDDITEKAELLKNITDRISTKMEDLFDNVSKKTSQLEQKVDILAQAETDSSDIINDLLAEFEKELNSELMSLRDMLGHIENRLKDPTFNEVTTEVLTKAMMDKLQEKVESAVDRTNSALIEKITGITQPASKYGRDIHEEDYDDSMQGDIDYIKAIVTDIRDKLPTFTADTITKIEVSTKNINDKLDELEMVMMTKTGSIEGVMQEIVKEASSLPAASKTFDITNDIEHLKSIASTLDSQLKEVEGLDVKSQGMDLKTMREQVEHIENQTKMLAQEYGLDQLDPKVNNLKDLSVRIAEKMEQFAAQVGDNIDLSEQLSFAASDEAQELLDEFTAELEEIREHIHTNASMTQDSIKAQGMLNEESINNLREDITASIDRMTSAITGAESGSMPFMPMADRVFTGEMDERFSQMKEVSAKISEKMESMLETIQKKTQTLEQKVDILAQSDTDTHDMFSELLLEFKEELLSELNGKQEENIEHIILMSKEVNDIKETVSAIKGTIEATPQDQVGKVIKEAIEDINMGEIIKQAMIETPDGSFDAIIAKEVSEINEKISTIQGNLENSAPDKLGELFKDAIEEVQMLDIIKDTIIASSGVELTKEMSREMAEMSEKLTNIEESISAASQKEVIELVKEIETSIADQITALREISEDVNNNLLRLDETAMVNVVEKLDGIIAKGVKVDTEILVDSVGAHLEQKLSEINIEEAVQGSVSDLTHKIEKLYEDVMDLTIALESKIDDLSEKDPSEDILNINDNIMKLKELNVDLSTRLEQLADDISVDAVTDMITDIETSIAREVEFLRNIGETINQGFTELEATIDTRRLESSLDELIEFNSDVAAKLDKVLDATGNIDSEALLVRIKEHLEDKITDLLDQDVGLEQILENLGSDLTEKLSHVIDHNQEIDTKLDKLMDQERYKQIESIMAEVHTLKTTSHKLEEKLDLLLSETQSLNIEDQIMELQRDIKDKIELIADVVNADNIIATLTENVEEFYSGIMEKTGSLLEKVEGLGQDALAEGIDNITTDISLLRNLTEDITEKVERVINNTEVLQTEEGMENFRKSVEEKLNKLIESDPSLNLENLLSSISGSLSAKIDEYSNTTRDYIADILSSLEENILAATAEQKDLTISDFVDAAEEKVMALQNAIKEMTARVEVIQDMTENTLISKTDIKDLLSSVETTTSTVNKKTDAIFEKIERQLDVSGLNNIKVLRKEMEKRLEDINEVATSIKERLDIDMEGIFSDKVSAIGQDILRRIESLSADLMNETSKIDEKVGAFAAEDIITQIDGLVSDVLVELDKEVNRIGKITANIDKNIITLDKNVKVVDKTANDIDEDVKKIAEVILKDGGKSSKDSAIESLIGFMQKDADQKLMLMKELIHTTAARGPGGELEQRLKSLEGHIATETQRQETKLKGILTSVKSLLEDLDGLKAITPAQDKQ